MQMHMCGWADLETRARYVEVDRPEARLAPIDRLPNGYVGELQLRRCNKLQTPNPQTLLAPCFVCLTRPRLRPCPVAILWFNFCFPTPFNSLSASRPTPCARTRAGNCHCARVKHPTHTTTTPI